MTNLKDKLMKEIKAGEVTMTPRIRFTLQWMTLVATSVAILAITVFIVNFIFFSIRLNSSETLLRFGPQGFGAFLFFFPWPLAILDVGLVFLLQWLLRHFKLGYRVPLLYLIGGLVVGAGMIGFALDRATPFNDRMHEGRGRLPGPMRGMYDGAHRPGARGDGICRCTILAIEGNKLTVEDTRFKVGEATSTLTVLLPIDDRRATTTGLSVGDIVFIAGEEKDGIIQAFGVKKEGERKRGPRPIDE
jgi:hypothetical protein